VILPQENEADLSELPEETREEIEFVLAETADQVLEAALGGGASARPQPAQERQAAASGTRS
jgi:ATP-dependent Lon protease